MAVAIRRAPSRAHALATSITSSMPIIKHARTITAMSTTVCIYESIELCLICCHAGGCNTTCSSPSGTCSCDSHHILNPDGKGCDVNYCSYNNGGCGQLCVNALTGACGCNVNYVLDANGLTCTFDNCTVSNNGCAQTCTSPGTCSCTSGYDLNADKKTCDLNNCSTNNGGCDHHCTFPGTCSCNSGYDLAGDGKTCNVNHCFTNNGLMIALILFCVISMIGGCSQVCTSSTGACSCNAGYDLAGDAMTCNLNHCFTNNGEFRRLIVPLIDNQPQEVVATYVHHSPVFALAMPGTISLAMG